MIMLVNETKYNINITALNRVVDILKVKRDIELLIVTNEKIHKLNREFRGVDKPTDVLSFPLEEIENMPLGSIVISIDKAQEAAIKYGHTIDEEISLLFIHGLLHLLGYDHEIDNGEMRAKEEELIKKLSLPNSLIVRSM